MAKVYISSTVMDLKAERQAVMDWLVAAGHQPMHSYRPDSETVRDSCLDDIDQCDLYVLILGHRYGSIPEDNNPNKLSITHLEFQRAKQSGIPRLALLRTSVPDINLSDLLDHSKATRVIAFSAEVRGEVRSAEFADVAGLLQGLSTGVQNTLAKITGAPVDPQVLKILATMSSEIERKNQVIDQYEAENASLRDQLKALQQAAVARTVAAAAQPDATNIAIAAAHSLEAGNTGLAEAWMNSQERKEIAQIGSPGADDAQHRREAAALAREQGALAMGHDVRAALTTFERAAEYEPDDTWTAFFLGDLHLLIGDLAAAMHSYRRAGSSSEARLHGNTQDWDAQRDLAVTHNRIGNVLVAQGDGPGALAAYRKALAIAETLAVHDPANTLWQRDFAVTHNRIGDVLVAQGDGPGALAAYRKALAIAETLAVRDLANTLWQRDFAVTHNRIGDVLVAQGDGPGALAAYRKALAIAETLAVRDPANTEWQRDFAVTHNRIGDVLVAQGDGPGALAAYRKALAIAETLAVRDLANTLWQRDLAVSHNRIGDVLVAQGDGPGALAAYRKALAIAEALAVRDPANTEWQRDFAVTHNRIGDVLVAQGDGPGALAAYRKALAIAETLAMRDPHNTQRLTDIVFSCAKLGTLGRVQSLEIRRDYLEQGRRILDELKRVDRLPQNDKSLQWFEDQLTYIDSLVPQ